MNGDFFIPNTRDKLVMNEPFETACRHSVRVVTTPENPSGTGSGYGNIKGYMDSYGTIMIDGCYKESIPYLGDSGFLCDGHGGAFGGRYPTAAEIGIFTSVTEDKEGLLVEWEYHDDLHSQAVRLKTEKRLRNDKTCAMSIGFFVGNGRNAPQGWVYTDKEKQPSGIDYICVLPQYYDEVIPMYSTLEYGPENLERAQNFSEVYIFLRIHVYEVSQTEIPANEVSLIAEVRHKQNKPMERLERLTKEERELRAKKDAKAEAHADAMDAVGRAFKKAKDAHEDCRAAHEAHGDALDDSKRAMGELAKRIKEAKEISDSEDDDKEDPKREAGRAAFGGGK